MRIIHTADVHLGAAAHGARLGRAAVGLRRARPRALGRVVELAREREADLVLIAGDLFDSHRPDPRVADEALRVLSGSPVPVAVIPGNHDFLAQTKPCVWTRRPWDDPPENVKVFLAAEPVERPWELDLVLYPCPLEAKDGSHSPVSWISEMRKAREGRAAFHVGLAHGSLKLTPDIGLNEFPIEPDEIAGLGLDYLALGHWHSGTDADEAGKMRRAYCGAPEPMSFGDPVGGALLVELSPGAIEVQALGTGEYAFRTIQWTAVGAEDLKLLVKAVEEIDDPEHTFLRIELEGVAPLAVLEEAERLEEGLAGGRSFPYVEVDREELVPEPTAAEIATLPLGPVARKVMDLLGRRYEAAGSDGEKDASWRALAIAYRLLREQM